MRIFFTIVLSFALLIAAFLLLLFSNCAFNRSYSPGVRASYGLYALIDLVVIAAGVWAIGNLHRKRDE